MFGSNSQGKKGSASNDPSGATHKASLEIEAKISSLQQQIAACEQDLLRFKPMLKTAVGSSQQSVKHRALTVLKRKKLLEGQLDRLIDMQGTMDAQTLAQGQINTSVMMAESMKEQVAAMKDGMSRIDIHEIEKTQDEMAEAMADQEELNEMMQRTYALPEGVDNDELDAEFLALEADVAAEYGQGVIPSYLQTTGAPALEAREPNSAVTNTVAIAAPAAQTIAPTPSSRA
eukprot:Filipodium_phascolosomae@DN7407_c0_g1_i1.p1